MTPFLSVIDRRFVPVKLPTSKKAFISATLIDIILTSTTDAGYTSKRRQDVWCGWRFGGQASLRTWALTLRTTGTPGMRPCRLGTTFPLRRSSTVDFNGGFTRPCSVSGSRFRVLGSWHLARAASRCPVLLCALNNRNKQNGGYGRSEMSRSQGWSFGRTARMPSRVPATARSACPAVLPRLGPWKCRAVSGMWGCLQSKCLRSQK